MSQSAGGVKSASKMATNSPLEYFSAVVERAGLVAFAIGAMDVRDGMSHRGVAIDDCAGDFDGFVGGVVEHLDLEAVARILHLADGVDEAVDDELLVEDGKLDGDARQFGETAISGR